MGRMLRQGHGSDLQPRRGDLEVSVATREVTRVFAWDHCLSPMLALNFEGVFRGPSSLPQEHRLGIGPAETRGRSPLPTHKWNQAGGRPASGMGMTSERRMHPAPAGIGQDLGPDACAGGAAG